MKYSIKKHENALPRTTPNSKMVESIGEFFNKNEQEIAERLRIDDPNYVGVVAGDDRILTYDQYSAVLDILSGRKSPFMKRRGFTDREREIAEEASQKCAGNNVCAIRSKPLYDIEEKELVRFEFGEWVDVEDSNVEKYRIDCFPECKWGYPSANGLEAVQDYLTQCSKRGKCIDTKPLITKIDKTMRVDPITKVVKKDKVDFINLKAV